MPLFRQRRAAKSANKWHQKVAAITGGALPSPTTSHVHEFHLFPYAQLSIATKDYLGNKKRSEAEQDELLIDLIQHHPCKEVAYAACLEYLSSEAAQCLLDTSFQVDTHTFHGFEHYLQAFVAAAHCKESLGLTQDRALAQWLIPSAYAVSNNGICPIIAQNLLTAWTVGPPVNTTLLVRARAFTKSVFQQIESELVKFKASLELGSIHQNHLDRVVDYSKVFATQTEQHETIGSYISYWRAWAAWSPDVDRLQKWTTVRNGTIFHCLVELDGPDFSLNETMHANSLSAIVQSEETLRNWLQSRGFTPGFGVIVEDSVQLRREFINLFTESALESLSRDKSDLLEYLITRNELDTHTLRCWQAADRLLDTAFVALLLPRTGACQDDAETEKILINGLKALATVFTQLVRGTLGKEIGTAVRKCTENLLSIVQLSVATGEDWLGPATRLWTLRTSISTSGWLHATLDPILVSSCISQAPQHNLNTLHMLQRAINESNHGKQTTLQSCFDIYVQSFLLAGICADDDTTTLSYALHRTWMHVQRASVRDLAVEIASLENLDVEYRLGCIKRLPTASEVNIDVLRESLVSLSRDDIRAIMDFTVVIDELQTQAKEDPCWRRLFIHIIKGSHFRVDCENFVAVGTLIYRQFLKALHELVGDDLELVQSTHKWLQELQCVDPVLTTLEADDDSLPAIHCILTAQLPEVRTRYLTMLQCLQQVESARKVLLHELVLTSRTTNSAVVCRAVTDISKISDEGFTQCEDLLMIYRKDRNVCSVRLAIWLRLPGRSDATKAALSSLGSVLNLGLDYLSSQPNAYFDAPKKDYAKRVAELVARAQRLERIQSSLKRSNPDGVSAMIKSLGIEAAVSGIARITAELPRSLTSVIKEVGDDEVELQFPLSKELNAMDYLAFGLKGTETLTVHLKLNEQGRFGLFCVHLHDRSVQTISNHNYYSSTFAPDRLYCGNDKLTRVTYAVSRNLWRAFTFGGQDEVSLQMIYEGVRAGMQTGGSQCLICGNHVGAQLHRGTICTNAKCKQALLKSPLDLRLQDVRSNGRVVDLLLTAAFAAANVSNLSLLPNCPPALNDAAKFQILLNSLPPTAALAAAKDFQTGLRGCGQRAELLMSWLCTNYRGFIVPATGAYKLPNMAKIHQFVVINNPPEIEAAFALHNHHQPRHVLFHGTSFDRLHAILVQGLIVCSHIPSLRAHGAASGSGIYTAREPSTSLGYSKVTQATSVVPSISNNFFASRGDFRDSRIILGLEHAGNHGTTGGVHVIRDPTRLMLRYIFLLPPNVNAPKSADIVDAMLKNFQSLKDAAAARSTSQRGDAGGSWSTERCGVM